MGSRHRKMNFDHNKAGFHRVETMFPRQIAKLLAG